MVDKLKKIPAQLLEFWNKYTSKQKTIIISVVAIVFFTIILLSYFLTRTQYIKLAAFENTAEASEVIDLLEEENIKYKVSSDLLVVSVDEKEKTNALMILGNNDITSSGMTEEDAFNNSISTTNDERKLKTMYVLQNSLRNDVIRYLGVKDAVVRINQPVQDYTILSEEKEASVSVLITTTNDFQTSSVDAIANHVANSVGNKTLDNIRITNQSGELLFGGNNDLSTGGNINSSFEYKQRLTNTIVNNVYSVLIKMGYDDAEIGSSNIVYNMDKVTDLYTEYTPADGEDQGVLDNSYTYESKGTTASGGVPGTDANGDTTTYNIETNGASDSSVIIEKNAYKPNERVTNTLKEIGAVKPDESSLGIVLINYKVIKEDDLKKQGTLDDITFDEYILQNDARTQIEVTQDVYNTVANTTGISGNNMTITAWEQPIFQATEKNSPSLSNYLMIILAVLIVALLIFVVFKGTAPMDVTELEPELSVEQLLATTKENLSLEDIEFGDKSETRKLIEKFVDENPEAVAQLLRNWLNEDWG